jgi:hypothetical protein
MGGINRYRRPSISIADLDERNSPWLCAIYDNFLEIRTSGGGMVHANGLGGCYREMARLGVGRFRGTV